jgi:nicotinate-nucleotide adenylyltransferase
MRIGLFGGSFDPVHLGHLLLAECCREQGMLDEVWFLPAAVPPHKQQRQSAPAEDRLAMLQLAIGGHEAFRICRLEIERGGVNYTVDTLETLAQEHPEHEWFFLMGGDSLADLPQWRNPARICELATPLVAQRPGSPPINFGRLQGIVSQARLEQIRQHVVELPQIGISSSSLRRRVAEGRSIRYRTPRAVEKYIETHGLYRSDDQLKPVQLEA